MVRRQRELGIRDRSRALQCVQQEVADALLVPPRYGSSAGHRVVVYSSQWDETMQKIRNPDRSGRAGAGRLSTQAVRIQTMVQSCKLGVFTFGRTGEVTHTEAPWFVRTLFFVAADREYTGRGALETSALPIRRRGSYAGNRCSKPCVHSWRSAGMEPAQIRWLWSVCGTCCSTKQPH